MKRVLAVLVAALLIAAALAARRAIDDDGGSSSGDRDRDERDRTDLVVACVPELADACEALDVADLRVEDPAATIDAAIAGDVDVWVTFDPWPAIAAEQEDRDVFGGEQVAVATTELVLVVRDDDFDDVCEDWACAADSGRAALPSTGTALGALLLGHAVAGWNDATRPGEPFASNDFELPEFTAWLRSLDIGGRPLQDMLQLGPAGPSATGTTQATYDTEVADSREADNLDDDPTNVGATVAVVLVGDDAGDLVDDDLLDALDELGYDVDVEPDTTTTGLPRPGVLLALQELP